MKWFLNKHVILLLRYEGVLTRLGWLLSPHGFELQWLLQAVREISIKIDLSDKTKRKSLSLVGSV